MEWLEERMFCQECGERVEDGARFCPSCGTRLDLPEPHLSPSQLASSQPQVPSPVAAQESAPSGPRHLRTPPEEKGRYGKFVASLFCMLGVFIFQVAGAVVSVFTGLDAQISTLVFGAAGAALFVWALGGGRLLVPRLTSIGQVLRQGAWSIAVSVGLIIYETIALTLDGSLEVADGWPGRVGYLVLVTILIGLFEEFTFRGVLLGGLTSVWGSTRRGLIACIAVSSLAFGCAHVEWWAIDLADPLQLAQALLKVCQTGTYALFLGTMACASRELWGVACLHGLNDFLLLFLSVGLMGQSMEMNYVAEDTSDALSSIGLYIVVTLLYIPLVVKAWKRLKTMTSAELLARKGSKSEATDAAGA